MVIDNADDQYIFFPPPLESTEQTPSKQDIITPLSHYLPQTSEKGLILITSRDKEAAYSLTNSDASIIPVDFMDAADAKALLCHKLKGMGEPEDRSTDTEKANLVEALGYLPLAITQAASYIVVRKLRMTVSKYSRFLEENKEILLENFPDNRRDTAYPNSVLLTWQISFNQIYKDNKSAAELLSLMSVLDRQGVPRSLLKEKNEDDLTFEKRLDPLIAYALISLDDDVQNFQLHRLVQIGVQSWLKKRRTLNQFKKQAAKLIDLNLPKTQWHFRENWEILLPHVQTVLTYDFSDGDTLLLRGQILQKTASYLNLCGRYDQAVQHSTLAFNLFQTIRGDTDDQTIDSLCKLGKFERSLAQDKWGTVLPSSLNREAMLCKMRYRPRDDPYEAKIWRDLLLESVKTLTYSQVERVIDTGIDLLTDMDEGFRDDETIEAGFKYEIRNALAVAYQKRGRLAEAARLQAHTLIAERETYGENDPRLSKSMYFLAQVMLELNKTEEAYLFGKECSELRLQIYGEEHPETLAAILQFAEIVRRRASINKDIHEATYMTCLFAVQLHERVLGRGHERTICCVWIFAKILADQDRYDEEDAILRWLLKLDMAVYSPEDTRTTRHIMTLAHILHDKGRLEKAEAVMRKLFEMYLAGWSYTDMLGLFKLLAETLRALGKDVEAGEIEYRRSCLKFNLSTKAPSRRYSSTSEREKDEAEVQAEQDECLLLQRTNSCPPRLETGQGSNARNQGPPQQHPTQTEYPRNISAPTQHPALNPEFKYVVQPDDSDLHPFN